MGVGGRGVVGSGLCYNFHEREPCILGTKGVLHL